jgi:CDP-paratose 2-epimerase
LDNNINLKFVEGKMKILITGAGGLIGSEAVDYYCSQNHEVYGIENNQRQIFFGKKGSTIKRLTQLESKYKNFKNYIIDIRDKNVILQLFNYIKFDVVIHTAAQPSHDKAASIPFEDFEINANGTLHLLEAIRQTNKDCIFIHMSTNKVYGDKPNTLNLIELETRYDYADIEYINGINENFSIDQSKHSLFGASKLAADVIVQEYGRYFDIPTCCLRGGCLTGENHSGVELHGFLNYLVKCNTNETKYNIFGYKGKQVRDNIHSSDVIQFMDLFIANPRIAEVYNIGGGYENSCSILEAFDLTEQITGKKMVYEYIDENRIGDHICYYSDLSKMKEHYPEFGITKNLSYIINNIYKNN